MRSIHSLCALLLSTTSLSATELLLRQPSDNQATIPSVVVPSASTNVEAADDFDVVGRIERVGVDSDECTSCFVPTIEGAWIRFYAWTSTGPGALQYEEFVPRSDPRLIADPRFMEGFEIELATPFFATGRHFVALQLQMSVASGFVLETAAWQNPAGSRARWRDRAAGTPWQDYVGATGPLHCDIAFELWGADATPPPAGTDPCGTWEVTPFPLPLDSDHMVLNDVHASSVDDVWAVGTRSQVWASSSAKDVGIVARWNGTQWSVVPSPNPEPYLNAGGVHLEGIHGLAANDLWAVGAQRKVNGGGFLGPQMFAMRWNGSSWSTVPTPVTADGNSYAYDVEVVAPNDVWIVGLWWTPNQFGSGNFRAMAMHWNGSQFTVHPTPAPFVGTPGFELEAIDAISSDDIWAVGGGSDGDPCALPYILHWDGSTWTYTPAPIATSSTRLYDVVAIASNDVYAVGSTTLSYQPLLLHWDGVAWTQVANSSGSHALEAYASDRVYVGGSKLGFGSGTSFATVETFPSVQSPVITALDAATDCGTWAVGRRIVAGLIVPFAARIAGASAAVTCAGDGSGTACPCGNSGGPGRGCANSASAAGASLTGDGTARVSADSLTLRAEGLPAGTTALFLQATAGGGPGLVFGDGLRCVGGSIVRLGTRVAIGGSVALGYLVPSDTPISARGSIPATGGVRHYQVWYRNGAPFCTVSPFNLTNGYSIAWLP
jgi:hypothetical protein